MNEANALLGLICETSLHAGAGAAIGVIDLPIQREGHNGWPCVFGSAVKGSLRQRGEEILGKGSDDVLAVFGPETNNADANAGAIAVGDARLALLPVRSLTSAFKWVTCPEALNRLRRDADRLGVKDMDTVLESPPEGAEAMVVGGGGDLFLEEYRFVTQTLDAEIAEKIIQALGSLMKRTDAKSELRARLTIVSDDMFSHLVQSAIPVNAHIALDSETKTVKGGALWYEETLPPETVLYVPLMAHRSRKDGHDLKPTEVLEKVSGLFAEKPWLQVGGNETVGMGWCAVSVLSATATVPEGE